MLLLQCISLSSFSWASENLQTIGPEVEVAFEITWGCTEAESYKILKFRLPYT